MRGIGATGAGANAGPGGAELVRVRARDPRSAVARGMSQETCAGPTGFCYEVRVEDVVAAFVELFPISSERFSLELVRESVHQDAGEVWGGIDGVDEGPLRATLRTIVWEVDGETRSIRDIKEQIVPWLCAEHREDPRVRAYLEGWAQAVRYVLAQHDELQAAGSTGAAADKLEISMPYDFFYPAVLRLRRPQTADQFTEALLSSKKRLGKLLP